MKAISARTRVLPDGLAGRAVALVLPPLRGPWPTTTDAEIYWMDASIIEDLRGD